MFRGFWTGDLEVWRRPGVFALSIGRETCLIQKAVVHKQLCFGRLFWVQVWVSYSLLYFASWLNAPGYGSSFQVEFRTLYLRSAAPMQVSLLPQPMIHSKVSRFGYL